MLGNGVDMYDLIPDLCEGDSELYSTGKIFWVGVMEGISPSPPVPRRKTRSYSAANVYIYKGVKVFSMLERQDNITFINFYKIPNHEETFIQ